MKTYSAGDKVVTPLYVRVTLTGPGGEHEIAVPKGTVLTVAEGGLPLDMTHRTVSPEIANKYFTVDEPKAAPSKKRKSK